MKIKDEWATEQLLTTTVDYVVNGTSGRVHRRFRIPDSRDVADFPRCNLDQIGERHDFDTREQAANWFIERRLKPKPCVRCFHPPTEEDEAVAEAFHTDEQPDSDPDAERVTREEMDPEDVPVYAPN